MEIIDYDPTPTGNAFILDHIPCALFYSWIVGPIGSGKTTADFMKLIYMAGLQARNANGTRKSRCVIVRNTSPQLKDTTMKSWFDWFKPGVAGEWHATDKIFDLKFGDIECEVLFRPLDTEDDVARVLSLELTFAIVDEFREVPRPIIDALSGRLGRYPAKRDGGATNFGMWGASNPGTEDVWWHGHLHNPAICDNIKLYGPEAEASRERLKRPPTGGRTTRYFHQPGGLSPYAENLANLPPYDGTPAYYVNQCVGKTPSWIKQYVDAEWGFSASETPVVKTFDPGRHVAKAHIPFSPLVQLVCGFDPGRGGMAGVFGYEDLYGRLVVLGEVGAVGMGVSRFINERMKPYLRAKFPNADLVVAPDPASINKAQTEEQAVVDVLRKHFAVKIETNNRFGLRLDAIEHYTTRTSEIGPNLIIDKEACPMVCRALAGGWRFEKIKSTNEIDEFKIKPEKNAHSHYGDAFGYLCRHYHRQFMKGRTTTQLAGGVTGPMTRPAFQPRRNAYNLT